MPVVGRARAGEEDGAGRGEGAVLPDPTVGYGVG